MRRKLIRIFGYGLVGFIVLDLVSCQIFDAVDIPREADGLIRDSVRTNSGWTVSYIYAPSDAEGLPRIIYVHGTPGNATSLQRYLTNSIDGFESVSIDRPGFGHTTPRKPALTMREQAQALEPFLVERDGRWPILVGHSMGAPVIARAAADYPDRVGGLVILSGALDPALEKIHWYQHIGAFGIIEYMIPRDLRNSNRELYTLKRELEEMKPLLSQVACPIVIVHAPDDFLVPYANVDYMTEQFSRASAVEVLTLDGKNHFVPWNAESEVRDAIVRLAAVQTTNPRALAEARAAR